MNEHFEGAPRCQKLNLTRKDKIQGWEESIHEIGTMIIDVAELKNILDIAKEDINNNGTYIWYEGRQEAQYGLFFMLQDDHAT